ncbi:hypothetical protein K438DRAFT_1775091 [Mycena galopus ATCC 62051]|nr:hypothetical protein K438DRAFT_1775091 [Mycena galopus ATCC 62051]
MSFFLRAVLSVPGLPGLPAKIYGVNLGSWCYPFINRLRLVLEPWMLPQGWLNMGGLLGSTKLTSMPSLKPGSTPSEFLLAIGLLNPSSTVHSNSTPERRGLQQLQDAGIVAILDHHALPGVQTAGQMFTGRLVISLDSSVGDI